LKGLFAYTLAIGSGVAVLALLCTSLVVWYSKRPEPWRKTTGELELVEKDKDVGWDPVPPPPTGYEIDDNGGLDFSFAVTNSTAQDLELREGQARLYFINTKSQALNDRPGATIRFPSDSTGKLPILLPSEKRVLLVVHLDQRIAKGDAAALYRQRGETLDDAMTRVVRFIHQNAPQFGGFVILDSSRRCEIDLPFTAK
jgi:hypothetical protein